MLNVQKVKQLAINNYERIFEKLGIDITDATVDVNEMRMACPIHGGDNKTAFCYYFETGVWKCYTSDCNNRHGHDIISLIMAVEKIKFSDALHFIVDSCNSDRNDMSEDYSEIIAIKKEETQTQIETFQTNIKPIPIDSFIGISDRDNEYFCEKFNEKTINKFMISICKTKGKPMYNRSFVPILDKTGENIIGFSGRTLYPLCDLCGTHHKKGILCPSEGNYSPSSKWIHWGCKTSTLLYNYSNANQEVKRTGTMIMVEGPKEVWWLDQCGIKNAVAILGSTITDSHLNLAIESGATTIITCFDKDGAGQKAFDKLINKFNIYFNIINLGELLEDGKDLDDMNEDTVKQIFIPVINKRKI